MLRAELLALLQEDGSWDPEAGPDPRYWERGTLTDVMDEGGEGGEDSEGGEGGWGVGAERLEALCSEELGPVVELQARLESAAASCYSTAPIMLHPLPCRRGSRHCCRLPTGARATLRSAA